MATLFHQASSKVEQRAKMGSEEHQVKEVAAELVPRLDHLDLRLFELVKVIQGEEQAARDPEDSQGFDSGMARS